MLCPERLSFPHFSILLFELLNVRAGRDHRFHRYKQLFVVFELQSSANVIKALELPSGHMPPRIFANSI